MAYAIQATLLNCILWLHEALGVCAYVFSSPAEGSPSTMDAVTVKSMLSRPLRSVTVNAIWEARVFTTGILFGLIVISIVNYTRSPWRKLPPGPLGFPIIGNALQVMDKDWLVSKDCKEHFGEFLVMTVVYPAEQQGDDVTRIVGEVMYLNAAGRPTIVLNSLKSSFELLERRANIYSDRPRFVMAQEILSQGLLFTLMNFGDRWRRMRRAAHEALTKRAVQRYHPIQVKEATILVSSLLSPSASFNPDKQFQRLAASTVMSIVYDYPTLESTHDPTIEEIEDYNLRVCHSVMPATYFVNIFPWMMYIPKRFARWKQKGFKQFTQDYAMFYGLLNRVRVDLDSEGDRPSFCASLLQEPDRNRLSEPEMTYLAGVLYAAGSETTATTLSWWMLAMMAFPEVQRRAQAELDAVVGRDRLPTFDDAPRLPYVRAIIKEILRWRPAAPLGVPHASTEDDWYEGMFIPKGTTCIPNLWHCNHDRAVFGEDADEFRPDRHLDEHGEMLPGPAETNQAGHITFGLGRRICVGKELVYDSLFIDTARVLWAAKVERSRDENGKELALDTDTLVDLGLVARSAPYECVVTPRFSGVMSILAEERDRFES